MKKYVLSLLRALIAFLIAMLVFIPLRAFVITVAYPALLEVFPNLLPDYNPVFDKEELAALNMTLSFIAAIISTFCVGAIEVAYDNGRLEYLISRTDGFYKISKGIGIYAREFLLADIISALIAPAAFLPLTLIRLPENAMRLSELIHNFLQMLHVSTSKAGDLMSYIIFAAVLIAARLLGAYSGLFRWRAIWLSDVEGGA